MPLSLITYDNHVQSYSANNLSVDSSGVIFDRINSPALTVPGSLPAASYLLFSITAFQ